MDDVIEWIVVWDRSMDLWQVTYDGCRDPAYVTSKRAYTRKTDAVKVAKRWNKENYQG